MVKKTVFASFSAGGGMKALDDRILAPPLRVILSPTATTYMFYVSSDSINRVPSRQSRCDIKESLKSLEATRTPF